MRELGRGWKAAAMFAGLAFAVMAMYLVNGCSQQQIQQGLRNASAADCATAASQQAFVNNLPGNPVVTPAQQLAILGQLCYAQWGSVAAPVTAPGNSPMIPAVPAVAVPVVPMPQG